MNHPLRYQISQWPQAADCLSNNSRNLRICVDELVNNKHLTGMIIKVEHPEMGVLFAAMYKGQGEYITSHDSEGHYIPWLTNEEIIGQLEKFGFLITYNEMSSLDDATISYLMRVADLGYDKLTKLNVITRNNGERIVHQYTVAMKSEKNDDLLTFGASVTSNKFTRRTSEGSILNLTESSNIEWNWLDSIYNIADILQDNADIEHMEVENTEDMTPYSDDTAVPTPEDLAIPEGFTLYEDDEE